MGKYKPRQKQTARCAVCGWRGTVNVDDTMRQHVHRDKFGEIVERHCAGSHKPPHKKAGS